MARSPDLATAALTGGLLFYGRPSVGAGPRSGDHGPTSELARDSCGKPPSGEESVDDLLLWQGLLTLPPRP